MTFVRTVLGDIRPEEMGLTYSHEHIVIEEGFTTFSNPDFLLNDTEKISEELKDLYVAGGRTMVDTMPAASGRNILKLADVSRKSGIHIIAPTGLHQEKYYPPNHWRYHLSVDKLTELFIKDISEGVDEYDYSCPVVKRSAHKAGMIKLATGEERITDHQYKIFEAVVNAHLETGAPVLTHTTAGKLAMDQVNLFHKLGANLHHVVLSHMDKEKDLKIHDDVMQSGVYAEYDSHFRWKTQDENWTLDLLTKMLPQYSNRIVLGMDMARKTYWRSYGGKPGLSWLITDFLKDINSRGLGNYVPVIFYSNPQRLYSIS